jgi:hypothetical protein
MNGGINQLVDTYKGNPQPLQAKVQKAQQGQPPGEIPPDLEEAMALQKIAELRNSAQGQQAMQAGGAQQSVVEKLRQMLGGMQQQAQMQGQPVMAAGGGSIDQLMSNLGRHYAGGGIIAFSKPTEENNNSLVDDPDKKGPVRLPGEDFSAYRRRIFDTELQAQRDRNVAEEKARELERQRLLAERGANNMVPPSPFFERAPLALNATQRSAASKPWGGRTDMVNDPRLGKLDTTPTGPGAPAASAPKPPAPPTAGKPSAGGPSVGGPAKPATEPADLLETALRKSIMDALAKDPEAIRKKAMEQNKEFMGLDALLKPAQDRAASREARIKEIQASRQPLWIDALMSAGKPTKGGIAGVLQNMAVGAISGKQNYDAEDLKFLDELNKLNSEIDKAKIEGRYKDVAAGKEAVKDLIAEQRQAEQSGTSLLNKQATLAQTKQIADDNRKSREIIAAANLEASKAKRLQDQNQFLANLEVKHTALLNNDKDYQGMIKQKQYIELQMTVTQDETKRAKLADQLQAQQAKMASYATNKVGGGMAGAANIPPPPPGAVRETVKKS